MRQVRICETGWWSAAHPVGKVQVWRRWGATWLKGRPSRRSRSRWPSWKLTEVDLSLKPGLWEWRGASIREAGGHFGEWQQRDLSDLSSWWWDYYDWCVSLDFNFKEPFSSWLREAFMTLIDDQAEGMWENIQRVSWVTLAQDFRSTSNLPAPDVSNPNFLLFVAF